MMNLADIEHTRAAHKARTEALELLAQRTRKQDGPTLELSSVGQVLLARLAGHAAALRSSGSGLRRVENT